MREYEKIETIFKRSESGTRKLIVGEYRNPAVEYLADSIWRFTEKIDGTNIRVFWDGHKVTFAGRTDRANIPGRLKIRLTGLFCSVPAEELFEQKFGEKQVILFGEGYGAGIQKGGSYRSDVDFILFDVLVDDTYLSREDVNDVARCFGIDSVPEIMRGTINDAVDFVKRKPKSTIGNADMEGLVGRPAIELQTKFGNRIIVKIKACDFE